MIDRMAVADDRVGNIAIPAGSMQLLCSCVRRASCATRYWENPGDLRSGALHQGQR